MLKTSASKKARHTNAIAMALTEPGLLGHVLSLAGSKEHLFFGGVCRAWRKASQIDARQQSAATETRLEAAVVSVARLIWAVKCGGLTNGTKLVRAAAGYVDGIAALQWMFDSGRLRPDGPKKSGALDLCREAAWAGKLMILQWARANSFPWDTSTCWAAAYNNHLQVLQWARANGCPWDQQTAQLAASRGHVEVLRWTLANGCPRDDGVLFACVEAGNLEVLQVALDHGCPGHRGLCRLLVFHGKLEMLQLARANGCPWSGAICKTAQAWGDPAIVGWIHANGCPCEHNLPADQVV